MTEERPVAGEADGGEDPGKIHGAAVRRWRDLDTNPLGRWRMSGLREDEYSDIAGVYDRMIGPLVVHIRRRVVRVAVEEGWGRVLDLCAGTGEQAALLARAGIEVVACDLSASMLAEAGNKYGSTFPLLRADAACLCFADQSFDAVVISFALHEKERGTRRLILSEVARVMDSNGRLLVIDYEPPAGGPSRWAYRLICCLERGAGRRHYKCFEDFINEGGNRKVIERAGYRVDACRGYFFKTVSLVLANGR